MVFCEVVIILLLLLLLLLRSWGNLYFFFLLNFVIRINKFEDLIKREKEI